MNDAMEQFGFVCKIVEWLYDKSIRLMESNGLSGSYQEVIKKKPLMPKGKLENLIRNSKSSLRMQFDGYHVYMPPLWKSDIFSLLWIKCNLGKVPPELRLYLEVYGCVPNGIRGVGFRFETPEANIDQSIHDYWHVHLHFEGVHEALDWAPDHIPCLPAVARCPVSLTLYLLRSLYDKDVLKQIVNKLRIPGTYLTPLHDRGLL